MGGDKAAGEELGREKGKVIFDWEDGCLCVKVLSTGHLHAASRYAEGRVLESLQSIDVVGFDVGEPGRGRICDEGSNEGFIGDDEGLFLLAPVRASKSTEDVEPGG